jgi:hypothetical protein
MENGGWEQYPDDLSESGESYYDEEEDEGESWHGRSEEFSEGYSDSAFSSSNVTSGGKFSAGDTGETEVAGDDAEGVEGGFATWTKTEKKGSAKSASSAAAAHRQKGDNPAQHNQQNRASHRESNNKNRSKSSARTGRRKEATKSPLSTLTSKLPFLARRHQQRSARPSVSSEGETHRHGGAAKRARGGKSFTTSTSAQTRRMRSKTTLMMFVLTICYVINWLPHLVYR